MESQQTALNYACAISLSNKACPMKYNEVVFGTAKGFHLHFYLLKGKPDRAAESISSRRQLPPHSSLRAHLPHGLIQGQAKGCCGQDHTSAELLPDPKQPNTSNPLQHLEA